MLVGVDTTTWIIFGIITFALLSKFLFGKVLGLNLFMTISDRVLGAFKKTTKKIGKKTTNIVDDVVINDNINDDDNDDNDDANEDTFDDAIEGA